MTAAFETMFNGTAVWYIELYSVSKEGGINMSDGFKDKVKGAADKAKGEVRSLRKATDDKRSKWKEK